LENLRIRKYDGQELAALAFIPVEPSMVLLVAHGFRGAKENGGKIYSFASRLQELGIAVYAFDFIGSGASDGSFADITLSRQADDLAVVMDYAYKRHQLPLLLLGRSFGGSTVMARGSTDQRVAGFILWSTPVMLKDCFARIMGSDFNKLKKGKSVRFQDEAGEFALNPGFVQDFDLHDMEHYLAAIASRPVLLVHGKEDEAVDFANAEYAARQLTNARLYLVDQADHRFTWLTKEREDITINWLRETFLTRGC
jgi:pimeloyl-ACP methyl ester carboxylesterase